PPEGTPTDFYLDPATGLVAAIGYRSKNFLRGIDTDHLVRMLDYRPVGGEPVAFTQRIYEDGKLAQAMALTRVERKADIPDSLLARPGAATAAAARPVTVPFDYSAGLLFVSASLNGGPPRRFVVDTGAGITILLPKVAQELGLKYSGDLGAGAGGGT